MSKGKSSRKCVWKAKAVVGLEMGFDFYSDHDRKLLEGFLRRSDMAWLCLKNTTLMTLLRIGCNGARVKTEEPIQSAIMQIRDEDGLSKGDGNGGDYK